MELGRFLVTGFAGVCVMPALGQEAPIDAFAPRQTHVLVSVPNAKAMLDAINHSPLGEMWRDASVQAWFNELTDTQLASVRESMVDMGIDIKELSPPTGQAGLAYFFVQTTDEDGETMPEQRMLVSADFGDGAEGIMKAAWRMLDKWSEDDLAIVDDDTYRDATIISVEWTPPENDLDVNDMENWDEEDWANFEPTTTPMGGLSTSMHAYLARLDGTIAFSDEKGMVERAVDALHGDDLDSIADSQQFVQARNQHPDGQHARAYFLMNDEFRSLVTDSLSYFAMMMPGLDTQAVLDALGLTEFQGAGVGLKFDAPDAMVDMTQGLVVAEKRGLIALFDAPASPFEPPSFIGASTPEVSRISVKFNELVGVAERVVGTLPEDQRAQINASLQMAKTMVGPLLDIMGPQLYFTTKYEKPYAAASKQFLIATPVSDELTASNTLAILTSQIPGGIEARDFEGSVIYVAPDGSIGAGVGYGHLFVGKVSSVEDAMRRAANPAMGGAIADDAAFEEATRPLSREMIVGSFTNMAERLDWASWEYAHRLEIAEAEIRNGPYPDDVKDQIIEQMRAAHENQEEVPPPPMDVIAKYMGNVVSELRSTPDGFRGRAIMLRPTER